MLQQLHQFGNVPLSALMGGYSLIALALALNTLIAQPWQNYAANSLPDVSLCVWQASWWTPLRAVIHRRPKKVAVGESQIPAGATGGTRSLAELLRTFEFWGECCHFSSLYLLANVYYISSLNQITYSKGDMRFSSEANSWDDYMFRRVGALAMGTGFAFLPFIADLLEACAFSSVFLLESALGLLLLLLLLLPSLEAQMVSMFVQCWLRTQLFSAHFAYLAASFGFAHFGTLNGLSSIIAAVVGLLNYPLQLLAIQRAGDHALPTLVLVVTTGVAVLFPVLLRRREQQSRGPKAVAAAAIPIVALQAEDHPSSCGASHSHGHHSGTSAAVAYALEGAAPRPAASDTSGFPTAPSAAE